MNIAREVRRQLKELGFRPHLQDVRFMIVFFGLSMVFLVAGIWFWVHQVEICEHPEDFQN